MSSQRATVQPQCTSVQSFKHHRSGTQRGQPATKEQPSRQVRAAAANLRRTTVAAPKSTTKVSLSATQDKERKAPSRRSTSSQQKGDSQVSRDRISNTSAKAQVSQKVTLQTTSVSGKKAQIDARKSSPGRGNTAKGAATQQQNLQSQKSQEPTLQKTRGRQQLAGKSSGSGLSQPASTPALLVSEQPETNKVAPKRRLILEDRPKMMMMMDTTPVEPTHRTRSKNQSGHGSNSTGLNKETTMQAPVRRAATKASDYKNGCSLAKQQVRLEQQNNGIFGSVTPLPQAQVAKRQKQQNQRKSNFAQTSQIESNRGSNMAGSKDLPLPAVSGRQTPGQGILLLEKRNGPTPDQQVLMHSQPIPRVAQVLPSPAKVGLYVRDPQRFHYDPDSGQGRIELRHYHGLDPSYTLSYFYPHMIPNSRFGATRYLQNDLIHQQHHPNGGVAFYDHNPFPSESYHNSQMIQPIKQEIISTRQIYRGQIDYFMEGLPSELGIPRSTPTKSPSLNRGDNVTELSSNAKFRKAVIDNKARPQTPKGATIEEKRRRKQADKDANKLHQMQIDDSDAKTTNQTDLRREPVENQVDFTVSSKKKPGRQGGRGGAEKTKSSGGELLPKKRSKLSAGGPQQSPYSQSQLPQPVQDEVMQTPVQGLSPLLPLPVNSQSQEEPLESLLPEDAVPKEKTITVQSTLTKEQKAVIKAAADLFKSALKKGCSCKRGSCGQNYCICRKNGLSCDKSVCQCDDRCCNDDRPDAQAARAEQKRLLEADVPKGCNCKKNHCLKGYCICHLGGRKCNPELCHCMECANFEGAPPVEPQAASGDQNVNVKKNSKKKATCEVSLHAQSKHDDEE